MVGKWSHLSVKVFTRPLTGNSPLLHLLLSPDVWKQKKGAARKIFLLQLSLSFAPLILKTLTAPDPDFDIGNLFYCV